MQAFWYLALSSALALSAYVLGRNHGRAAGKLEYVKRFILLVENGYLNYTEKAKTAAKQGNFELIAPKNVSELPQ